MNLSADREVVDGFVSNTLQRRGLSIETVITPQGIHRLRTVLLAMLHSDIEVGSTCPA